MLCLSLFATKENESMMLLSSSTERAPDRFRRLVSPGGIAALIIILAICARTRALSAGNSLYLDEAMLALNVLDRGYGGLVGRLDYNQHAPLGFLVALKFATQVVSEKEFGLRLVPFLAGALALPVFWRAAVSAVGRWPAVLSVSLFALTRPVAEYAVMVKQYSLDILFTCLILFFVCRAAAPFWRVVLSPSFLLLAVGAPLCSQPSVFVLAAVYTVAFLAAARSEGIVRALAVVVAAVPWAASFVANYWFCIRPGLVANDVLFDFWSEGFAPLPTSPERLKWYLTRPFALFEYPSGLRLAGGVAVAAFVIGLTTLRGPKSFVRNVIIVALGLGVIASSLRLYPLHDRMALWLVPLLLMPIGAAVGVLFSSRESRLWGVTLVAILVTFPLLGTVQQILRPEPGRHEIVPLLATIREEGAPGDDIFLTGSSGMSFRYYARRDAYDRFRVSESVGTTWDEKRAELRRFAGRRVWIVFCGESWRFGAPEELVTRDWLRELAVVRFERQSPGGTVLLVEFHDRTGR